MFFKEMKESSFNCWKQISSLDTPTPKTTLVLCTIAYITLERAFDYPRKL
jgi:hypothetical protein